MYPLSQPLNSGQTVEIITSPSACPSASWLNFIVSSKARVKVRRMLKTINHDNLTNLEYKLSMYKLNKNKKLANISLENIQKNYATTK